MKAGLIESKEKILFSLTRVFFIRRQLLKLRKHLGEGIAAVLCVVGLGSFFNLAPIGRDLRFGGARLQPISEAIADDFGRYQSSGEGCSDNEQQDSPHPGYRRSLSNLLWILTGFLLPSCQEAALLPQNSEWSVTDVGKREGGLNKLPKIRPEDATTHRVSLVTPDPALRVGLGVTLAGSELKSSHLIRIRIHRYKYRDQNLK